MPRFPKWRFARALPAVRAGVARLAPPGIWGHEAGQSLVEYVLILSLVSIVLIEALAALGTAVADLFPPIVAAL